MTDIQFPIALRFGARKALRQGKITRDEFRIVKNVLRDPVRYTDEYGSVNVLGALQDFATSQMLSDESEESEELAALNIFALITYILNNMDSIMAFIQQIIDLFNGIGAVASTQESSSSSSSDSSAK